MESNKLLDTFISVITVFAAWKIEGANGAVHFAKWGRHYDWNIRLAFDVIYYRNSNDCYDEPFTIMNTERLTEFCEIEKPILAILCVPRNTASEVAEQLAAECGIKAFWNFSNCDLRHLKQSNPGVIIENVHLCDSLTTLSYELNKTGNCR